MPVDRARKLKGMPRMRAVLPKQPDHLTRGPSKISPR
jgi:hypothetical protein